MSPTALVVDDAEDLRALVRAVLESSGFAVQEAANGREALDSLAESMSDVVVLDVQMPDLDGWDTLTAIRSDSRIANVAVVLCTVRAQQADVERAWSLGCDAFLAKPFATTDLVRAVTDALTTATDRRGAR